MIKAPEIAFVRILEAAPEIVAKVSTRIHWRRSPQNEERPYLVYRNRGQPERVYSLSGPSRLARTDLELLIVGEGAESAFNLRETIREALDGWKGIVDGFFVQSLRYSVPDEEESIPLTPADELLVPALVIVFEMWHRESAPGDVDGAAD